MQVIQNHCCPECLTETELVVTLGCVRYFKPASCPSCGQEILDEEVDEYEEEDEEEWNFYCNYK